MSTLIYLDTNIYLDFLLAGRPKSFAEDAFQVFQRTLHCEFSIILSKKIKTELYPNIQGKESALLFSMLKPKLHIVPVTKADEEEAKNIDAIDTADALHALLAKKYGANYLITQNMQHFKKFHHLILSKRPSEI